jgi:MoxR-like ATPase
MNAPLRFLPRSLPPARIDRRADSPADDGSLEIVRHVFDRNSIAAVNGALAAGRPLLVRGEPGVGKTQLAAAVAAQLDRPCVPCTVNARTEPTDLLWKFDAVRRLAEAQICGAGRLEEGASRQRLAEWRFVTPGPLWWGFDWHGAQNHLARQAKADRPSGEADAPALGTSASVPDPGGNPAHGIVVLIDEIDKADADVPNGLLEALGARRFTPLGCETVKACEPAPLVIITTNEERVLPDAFVRRCLVLHITPPDREEYIARGKAHFGTAHNEVLDAAVDQLLEDRKKALPPRPGLAEYLDLVRAVLKLAKDQNRDVKELIDEIGEFTFRKQSGGTK